MGSNRNVFTAFELINNDVTEMPCLFGNIIPKTGICAVVGCSESGKSLFLRQICMAVATSSDFIGMENKCSYGKAIFVSTEDGIASTSYLMKRQDKAYNMSMNESKNIKFVFSPINTVDSIRNELSIERVDIVVIDSFSDILNGKDEKSASDIRSLMMEYQNLSEEFDCLIVFLHHISKRSEFNTPSKNSVIGSQSFEAKCRLVMELREDNTDSKIRHLCIIKGNYISKDIKSESIDLVLTDNLVFELSDSKTPLAMLSITKQTSNGKTPSNISDKFHIEFLCEIFGNNSKPLTGASIKRAVVMKFNVGDTLCRKYLNYYRSKNFIIVEKETKNCVEFKLNDLFMNN